MKKVPQHGGHRSDAEDLRALGRLIIDATLGVTNVVQSMHQTIGAGPAFLGSPLAAPLRLLIAPTYGAVRGVTRLAGAAVDRALAGLAPLFSPRTPGPQRMALLAALNGVLGDRLLEAESPLALPMGLCRDGEVLRLDRKSLQTHVPKRAKRVVVLVHGSSMNDVQWLRAGHDHGAMLEEKLGFAAIYLRYNTGLHISTNGRELAQLLQTLVEQWPHPNPTLTLIGHSMGGLVIRSACEIANQQGLGWRTQLAQMVFLGSPHHGAPLERAGNWVDYLLGISRYSAPLAVLGKIRSAGVTDLRYGNVRDEDWQGSDRFKLGADARWPLPLPREVECFTVAATTSPRSVSRLRSDGLVPVPSALGMHPDHERTLAFPQAHQFVAYRTDHLGLLDSREVADVLQQWLGAGRATKRAKKR